MNQSNRKIAKTRKKQDFFKCVNGTIRFVARFQESTLTMYMTLSELKHIFCNGAFLLVRYEIILPTASIDSLSLYI